MKLTQHELAMRLVKERGSIIPAKLCGEVFYDTMCGSDFPKRCRELRSVGVLGSTKYGKYTLYYLPGESMGAGYDKFKEMGDKLKGEHAPKKAYVEMSLIELNETRSIAERWLKENENNPAYPKALEKYEYLCDVMRVKESGLLTPKENI